MRIDRLYVERAAEQWPATNEILKKLEPLETISIYDVSGKLLIRTEGKGSEQHLELNGLSSGVYILNVKTGKEIFTGRIIRK